MPFHISEDPLRNMYEELGPRFKEKLLTIATHFAHFEIEDHTPCSTWFIDTEITLEDGTTIEQVEHISKCYTTLIRFNKSEMTKWRKAYEEDNHFKEVLNESNLKNQIQALNPSTSSTA
ncbi:hypothetical protein BDQ17DRAFT_1438475 [Cyathus striatus]|nr:hypothetical protein BDQ17DRAFT_1438475 [Cyathus striatus]